MPADLPACLSVPLFFLPQVAALNYFMAQPTSFLAAADSLPDERPPFTLAPLLVAALNHFMAQPASFLAAADPLPDDPPPL